MGWVTDNRPNTTDIDACVQCGLCLPVCPTFRLTGRETASPRGRIHAMAAVDEGSVEVDGVFAGLLDFCLGCRACEPVCPGLVPYGRLLEGSRSEIVAQVPGRARKGRWTVGRALRTRSLLRLGGMALAVAQIMRLTRLAPRRYKRVISGLRPLKGRGRSLLGHRGPDGPGGRIGLLSGCVQDEWFRPVNRLAVELLERAGFTVEVPRAQTCCGALAAHDGHAHQAQSAQGLNVDVFGDYDYLVATAAGCSAHLKDYRWPTGGPEVVDITVLVARAIASGDLPRLEPSGATMAVQDPCHLRHAQRVIDEPREIVRAAGYEVVEIDKVGMCCGAAGMYTIHQPEASEELGKMKGDQVRGSGSHLVASANPGCEMQLRSNLGDDYEIRHPIEWYASAVEPLGSPT